MSSTVRIIDNYGNDSFIKSIAVLKQLLLQSAKEETVIQHEKSTTEDKDEEPQDIVVDVEAEEPSISEDTAVAVGNVVTTDQTNNHENEETMNNNETNVDVNEDQHQQLQLKLANAEKDVLTERALRASLEKAFDDLSVHRKLLQEQIDHLLYQQQQYNNSQQNEEQDASLKNTSLFVSDVEDFTVSKMNDVTTDSNEQPNSSTNDTVEAQTMDIERSDDNTRNQEESQEKSISLETEHERVTETTSSHDVLQSKFDALQEEYNNLQQKYEQMIADSGSYKDDSNPESSSSLGMIDSGKQSEEQDLSRKDELESLRKERENIIQFLLHHSRTSISMGEPSAIAGGNRLSRSDVDISMEINVMLTQLQSYRDDVSRLELELSDARKETARLQADDSKASSKKDTSNEKDEDVSVAAKSEDIHMDDDDDADKSNERKELKDEVAFLRGALNDAIGEASRSQNILNSLESRLHEKESLIYFCQKVKKESESLIRMKSENITDANSGNVDNKETTTVPVEADKEDSSKDVAQEGGLLADTAKANLDEIQSQLFDTKQLLEQNKKLVTVLQNKVQNMDDDIYGKDQMIKDLLMRLEVLESENSRAQTQLLIYEKRFSTLDGDDEEEEDDDDEDDDDDDDEEEEEGSYQGYDDDEGGHGGPGNDGDDDSEVEIIEVIDNDDSNDDDEEDEEENDERNDDHQQDEVHQRRQNSVIDEHIQDDAGEQEPSPKKQRMEDSSIVDHDTLDV